MAIIIFQSASLSPQIPWNMKPVSPEFKGIRECLVQPSYNLKPTQMIKNQPKS